MSKRISIIFILSFLAYQAHSQWTYLGNAGDTCTPTVHAIYSSYSWQTGYWAYSFRIMKNDTIVYTKNNSEFGCCFISYINPFTDNIVSFVYGTGGPRIFMETSNNWQTCTQIDYLYGDYDNRFTFINGHSFYVVLKSSAGLLSIKRLSDVRNRYVLKDDSVNMNVQKVELYDTIFGEPYCAGTDSIAFRFQKNSQIKEYWIYFTQTVLSEEERVRNSYYKVYPNPAIDRINVEVPQEGTMIVFDQLGKVVFNAHLNQNLNEINISFLNKGIYFIKVMRKDHSESFSKLIVQ